MKKTVSLFLIISLLLCGCSLAVRKQEGTGTETAGKNESVSEKGSEKEDAASGADGTEGAGNDGSQNTGSVFEVTFAESVPELDSAVMDYAFDIVKTRVSAVEENSGLVISDAQITKIEQMNTGTAGLNESINLYLLEYRLTPRTPYEAMQTANLDFLDGKITEKETAGQPYFIMFVRDTDEGREWKRVCVTNTAEIDKYDTEEILSEYGGNKYTAATMILYGNVKENLNGETGE